MQKVCRNNPCHAVVGNCSLRCSTSCIHAVVRRPKGTPRPAYPRSECSTYRQVRLRGSSATAPCVALPPASMQSSVAKTSHAAPLNPLATNAGAISGLAACRFITRARTANERGRVSRPGGPANCCARTIAAAAQARFALDSRVAAAVPFARPCRGRRQLPRRRRARSHRRQPRLVAGRRAALFVPARGTNLRGQPRHRAALVLKALSCIRRAPRA